MKLKNTTLLPLLLITQLSICAHLTYPNKRVQPVIAEEPLGLSVTKKPYLTKLSLGDDLFTNGLEVSLTTNEGSEVIKDYSLSGFDPNNLGEQTITITYQTYITSFDVFVTNENVFNTIDVANDVFISEVINLSENEYGLELYNNTPNDIDISNYKVVINLENNSPIDISLSGSILKDETFTIASSSATNINIQNSDIQSSQLDFNLATSINLVKNENSIIDKYSFTTSSWFQESNYDGNVTIRHYRNQKPETQFNGKSWYKAGNDTSNFNQHHVVKDIVTFENQAKAFARYVMFGAGMFAAGRVSEAFNALKTEYDLMSEGAKQFFINNKDTTVQGINESNKLVSVTFREAHSRIAVLASRSGNPSFIPSSFSINFNFETIAPYLIIGVAVVSIGGYFLFIAKKKKS
jgi:hypothetical protein